MKKLMIAAAIALTAIVTQATSVNWQVAGILIPVADDVTKDQSGISVAYGVNTPFAANALTLNLYYNDKSDGTGNWQSVGSYKNDAEGGFADYQQVWSQAEASGIISAVGGNSVYLMYDATYETADGVYTYSSEAVRKNISKAAAGTLDVNYDFDMPDGTWNYTANPVPEPTSGLLLLLGMAGLALRRRRA